MSRCCWFHRRPETTGSLLSSLVSRVPTELAGSRATWGHGTPQSRVTVHARPRARPQSRLREQRSWLSLLLPTGRAHAVQSPRVGSLWGPRQQPGSRRRRSLAHLCLQWSGSALQGSECSVRTVESGAGRPQRGPAPAPTPTAAPAGSRLTRPA